MPSILALDPGPVQTGWAWLDSNNEFEQGGAGIASNEEILAIIYEQTDSADLAIEMIASYGMAVGKEIFETCVWIGRYVQAYRDPDSVELIFRREVKSHVCGTSKAKDPNVRQAIIDMFPPGEGGGKCPQVGSKLQPGILYGVTGDAWAALGVAFTARKVNPHRKLPV